ncbi:GNAT family N-acetyltransferase [Fictibacillus iocasae]|uniref:GNAT family N-acetyltransferase n=1 Tax=Fictibacillus iocasae TaxID=2715437 RepID=A0ABW2NPE8_9BACL
MEKELQFHPSEINHKSIKYIDEFYYQIQNFSCENSSMERFLKKEAHYADITREACTTVIYVNELAAYYTLLRTPIEAETDADMALHIARLAVDNKYKGKGLGTFLVKQIVDNAYQVNESFITTDALYDKW